MSDSSHIAYLAATGDATTESANLRGIVLTTAAAAPSTVTVRAGGLAGPVVLLVSQPAPDSTLWIRLPDVLCPDGIHVTFGGAAGAVCSVLYA